MAPSYLLGAGVSDNLGVPSVSLLSEEAVASESVGRAGQWGCDPENAEHVIPYLEPPGHTTYRLLDTLLVFLSSEAEDKHMTSAFQMASPSSEGMNGPECRSGTL